MVMNWIFGKKPPEDRESQERIKRLEERLAPVEDDYEARKKSRLSLEDK